VSTSRARKVIFRAAFRITTPARSRRVERKAKRKRFVLVPDSESGKSFAGW